jgi:ABC-type Zn2+ transport system substrate-binding protein/surface adhesin
VFEGTRKLKVCSLTLLYYGKETDFFSHCLACDPFAKKKRNDPSSYQYDESPDEFNARQKRKQQKEDRKIARVERLTNNSDGMLLDDGLLQEQARRDLRSKSAYSSTTTSDNNNNQSGSADDHPKQLKSNASNDPKINLTIKPGESMKAFIKRVSVEKKKILLEELPKLNESSKRRKEKFKQIKKDRKLKKKGLLSSSPFGDEETMEFGSREDGYIRPSDRQDFRSDFQAKEIIPFGETVHAPPNLKSFISSIDKKLKVNKQKEQLEQLQQHLSSQNENQEKENDGKEEFNEEDEDNEEENNQKKKKRKRGKNDWDMFNSDEQGNSSNGSHLFGGSLSASINFQKIPTDPLSYLNEQKKKQKQQHGSSSSSFSQQELEKTRKEVQQKYKEMKEKKQMAFPLK